MRLLLGSLALLALCAAPVAARQQDPAPALPEPATARAEDPTVSSPPITAAPAAGSAHARAGVVSGAPVSASRAAASTVTGYEKGRSLTVKTPAGTLVKYRLAKDAEVPSDLGAGRKVLVETKVAKKRRYATRVSYAEGQVVVTNVN